MGWEAGEIYFPYEIDSIAYVLHCLKIPQNLMHAIVFPLIPLSDFSINFETLFSQKLSNESFYLLPSCLFPKENGGPKQCQVSPKQSQMQIKRFGWQHNGLKGLQNKHSQDVSVAKGFTNTALLPGGRKQSFRIASQKS